MAGTRTNDVFGVDPDDQSGSGWLRRLLIALLALVVVGGIAFSLIDRANSNDTASVGTLSLIHI